MALERPSIDEWLREAKADPAAGRCGMFLTHVGSVRETPKQLVRGGVDDGSQVVGMRFSYDQAGVDAAIERAKAMDGIYLVRVWLNSGELTVGDDIMQVMIGGDIRPHVIDALQELVGTIKSECVREDEVRR
ncbi:MAG: molybdenum cofactor biosynthesis protein MoaE [Coriobacteriales bacterium]|jgi:molybdopterin synthase catalytic subunit